MLAAVGRSQLSERRLSMLATGGADTIRNIRRGAVPRVDTLEALCEVLGLELQIAPALRHADDGDARGPRTPTQFSGSRQLPVYEWSDPSEEGYLRKPDSKRAPAPENIRDPLAFYLRMPDHSMVPARIGTNDYCLVSPCAELEVDQRAWFRRPTGRETMRWVMRLSATGYDLAAWDLDEVGHQKPTAVNWRREDIVDRGVLVAVFREEPTVEKTLQAAADWRPDPLAELWRSSMFDVELKRVAHDLDNAVKVVEDLEMRVKRSAATGAISAFHAEQLLRVLDHRLQASLRTIRSSVVGDLSDGG